MSRRIELKPLLINLVLILGIAGMLPSLYFESRSLVREGRRTPIDRRYGGLASTLPADTRLGHVSDLPTPKDREIARLHAQYALAPHLMDGDYTSTRYVLAEFSEPAKLEAFCAANQFHIIKRVQNGVALLERETAKP